MYNYNNRGIKSKYFLKTLERMHTVNTLQISHVQKASGLAICFFVMLKERAFISFYFYLCGINNVFINFDFFNFLFKINFFLVFSVCFDVLMSKIIL
jgi:hypothetical protein